MIGCHDTKPRIKVSIPSLVTRPETATGLGEPELPLAATRLVAVASTCQDISVRHDVSLTMQGYGRTCGSRRTDMRRCSSQATTCCSAVCTRGEGFATTSTVAGVLSHCSFSVAPAAEQT